MVTTPTDTLMYHLQIIFRRRGARAPLTSTLAATFKFDGNIDALKNDSVHGIEIYENLQYINEGPYALQFPR